MTGKKSRLSLAHRHLLALTEQPGLNVSIEATRQEALRSSGNMNVPPITNVDRMRDDC